MQRTLEKGGRPRGLVNKLVPAHIASMNSIAEKFLPRVSLLCDSVRDGRPDFEESEKLQHEMFIELAQAKALSAKAARLLRQKPSPKINPLYRKLYGDDEHMAHLLAKRSQAALITMYNLSRSKQTFIDCLIERGFDAQDPLRFIESNILHMARASAAFYKLFTNYQSLSSTFFSSFADASAVIKDAAFAFTEDAVYRKIDVRIAVPETLPVSIDRDLLYLLVYNSGRNSMKSLSAKKPEDAFIEFSAWAEGNEALICVLDNGLGIGRKDIYAVLKGKNRFSAHNLQSSGAGMAMNRHIIRSFNGKMEIQGKKGEFALFTCKLPLAENNVYIT